MHADIIKLKTNVCLYEYVGTGDELADFSDELDAAGIAVNLALDEEVGIGMD